MERATDAGAMAYLVKPYQRAELVPAIETALARFRELRALDAQVGALADQLEVRKIVDRAKGRLIDAHALSKPTRSASSNSRRCRVGGPWPRSRKRSSPARLTP